MKKDVTFHVLLLEIVAFYDDRFIMCHVIITVNFSSNFSLICYLFVQFKIKFSDMKGINEQKLLVLGIVFF